MTLDERARAEKEMARGAEQQPHTTAPSWPSAARRIAEARAKAGLSDVDVAHRLGITVHSYTDLETYDGEAFTAISLGTLRALASVLDASPEQLLLGSVDPVKQTITCGEIAKRVAERITKDRTSAEQFGDAIGWDVRPVLADPNVLLSWDVEALYNIAKAVSVDWVAALRGLAQPAGDAELSGDEGIRN